MFQKYRLGACRGCNQRMLASYRCARIGQLVMLGRLQVGYFDRMLDEVVELWVAAAESGDAAVELN